MLRLPTREADGSGSGPGGPSAPSLSNSPGDINVPLDRPGDISMAQVLVPGVAQAVLSGTYGTQPWAVVTHWSYDNIVQDWGQSQIQALADQLASAWNT